MTPRVPKAVWLIGGLGWLLFVAGLVSFAFLYLRHGGSSIPKVRWHSRWGRPRWVTFRDPEGQFLIDYPSDWDMSAPFERFTRHPIGGLIAADTMALRHAGPTGLLVIIRYAAPQAIPTGDWLRMTRSDGALKDIFGETILSREAVRLADHEALRVVAQGRVADKLYRLESWFVPDGASAYRLTLGAPTTEFDLAAPTLHRIVSTFRFTAAPGRPVRHSAQRRGGSLQGWTG
jgi:hypothetical protein